MAMDETTSKARNLQESDGHINNMFIAGISQDKVQETYKTWAKTYERTILGDSEGSNYSSPREMTKAIADLFPQGVRDKVAILDVGAGTGLGGQMLNEKGFLTIDALDPSSGMLEEAKNKKVYRNFFNCFITAKPLDIPADTYDAIGLAGVMHYGALQCEAFEEMTRLVKPGGYIVNCMRKAFLEEVPEYKREWQPMVTRLEKEGKWKMVKTEPYANHYKGHVGLLTVFQVC